MSWTAAADGAEPPGTPADVTVWVDGRLQGERPIGGQQRVGVAQVDLVLAVHELVVEGEDLQPECSQALGRRSKIPPGSVCGPTV
jgi:hypothetical protein